MISQFFVIAVGILFVSNLPNLFAALKGEEIVTYTGYYPLLIIFTGFLSSLPTCLLWFREEPTKRQCYVRMVLHFIVVEMIVLLEGFLFGWYYNLADGIKLAGMVALVFVIVYVYSYFANKDTANAINEALAGFWQEENE